MGKNGSVIPMGVRVVVQDPHLLMRDCLRQIVSSLEGAEVVGEAAFPPQALKVALRTNPDIVLLDMSLVDEALSVIGELAQSVPSARVICLADHPKREVVAAALEAGAAGVALKSDSAEQLLRAFEGSREGRKTVAPALVEPILHHYLRVMGEKRARDAAVIETLASAVDAKDSYTGKHVHRVASVAATLAAHFDPALQSNEPLHYGFILHDVGKIGIPDAVLLKPGNLDPKEWEVMRAHTIIGSQIIAPLALGEDAEGVVRHHHERWDGTGYPDRLAEKDIPLGARLFSVADAFDAMTNDRPYREGMPVAEALEEVRKQAGSQFDPDAVSAFMDLAHA